MVRHVAFLEDKVENQRLAEIGERYQLEALYVFGSRAAEIARRVSGQAVSGQHPEADVDIGVRPAPGHHLGARERVGLAMELEDLLGVRCVDLVVLPEADPFVAAEVVRGDRLHARDEHAADEYELYVLRRAGDLAPLERERMALILGEGR